MRTLISNSETFWWLRPNRSSTAFNEDADDRPAQVNNTLSSSLDTTAVDMFRQGVEVTTWRHWAQGIVKITAGEPGHIVQPENYGLRSPILKGQVLVDKDAVDPVKFINASTNLTHRTSYLFASWPPANLSRTESSEFLLDGVLDAVDVRNVNACFGGDVPYEGRGVRGAVMAGNIDEQGRSDIIVTYIEPITSGSFPAYKDIPDTYGLRWPNTRYHLDIASLQPFTDRTIYLGEEESPSDPQIVAIVNHITGSGDFLPPGCRASTSGWVYDDGVGTDSIAFGGLTY